MSSLNLTPNPALIIAHASIFLANVYLVKKLLVDPYLLLRDKRVSLTSGGQERAEQILGECEAKSARIAETINTASSELRAQRAQSSAAASTRQYADIEAAKTAVKGRVEQVRAQLSKEFAAEKAKIPSVVTQLSQSVYSALLH